MNYRVYDSENNFINTVFSDEQFIKQYCAIYGYRYELEDSYFTEQSGEPDPQADTDAMMIDHEYRLTLLELGITE